MVILLTVCDDGIRLHAQRIRREPVSAMMVVERIEHYAHHVVVVGALPFAHARTHEFRHVSTDKHHIQVVGIVGKEGCSSLAGGNAVPGLALPEIFQRCAWRGRTF